ncbi:hypothetical protein BDP27DRAFT_1427590 [Rhodocollybia butyracea]|uniref:Uncharacterized protein n=1 Tax=Rhodocollybia butyracea TaxID=206335 RepID=A0A9P5PIL8_9AGAR|nr:hypothetical protein BDP27DRAFT_1427590 [Rhodocollybia butyracea]
MLNYDVITVICAQISDREIDLDHSVSKDLLSLGLASKKSLGPALDMIWKRISSIEPLLSVLPETALMFLGPIAPSSWDRLHFYTSRVREFNGPWEGEEPSIHDSVYAYLGQGKLIFPKLRKLHLTHQLCCSNSFTPFLATSLQVVSWGFDLPKAAWSPEDNMSSSEIDLGPSLALLVSKNPKLECLTLGQYSYSGLSLSLSRLCTLELLSANHLPHLEMGFIQAIASLPKLINLYLTLPTGTLLDYTGVEGGFRSLTKLELRGSTFDTRKFLALRA